MNKVLVLHGPNLNLLGRRQPEIYGHETLADIDSGLREQALLGGWEADCRQSNHEGELIDWIQAARLDGTAAIIINPAAYTHTSVAILDALNAFEGRVIEVHLSNPMARELFRHHSYFSDLAVGTISGLGGDSYRLALEAALTRLPVAAD